MVPSTEELAFLGECLTNIRGQDLWYTFLIGTVRKVVMTLHLHILHLSNYSKQTMNIEAESLILSTDEKSRP